MFKRLIIIIFAGIIFIMAVSISIGFGTNINLNKKSNDKGYDVKPSDYVGFNKTSNKEENIKVYITKTKSIKQISLENYIVGVVSSEMPAEFNIEALKAQAIAARTFAVAHMSVYGGKPYNHGKGADVTDDVECQVYMDKEERIKSWPSNSSNEYWNKINEAVNDTRGQVITYDGSVIKEPLYFAISSGKTEDSKEVLGDDEPYLKSVTSEGENVGHNKYKSQVKITYSSFIDKVKKVYKNSNLNYSNVMNSITILSRTKGDGVKEIKIGNNTITGVKFRSIMGINSTNFVIKYNSDNIEIDCTGYGHDVGMSQWGANVMAQNGKSYSDILKHYYTGINIEKLYD